LRLVTLDTNLERDIHLDSLTGEVYTVQIQPNG